MDDPGSAEISAQGTRLAVRVEGTSAGTVRATVDDLLACVSAAEKTAGIELPTFGDGAAPPKRRTRPRG